MQTRKPDRKSMLVIVVIAVLTLIAADALPQLIARSLAAQNIMAASWSPALGFPDLPGSQSTSGIQSTPIVPSMQSTPGNPGNPGNSGNSGNPGNSGTSANTLIPGATSAPGTSTTRSTPAPRSTPTSTPRSTPTPTPRSTPTPTPQNTPASQTVSITFNGQAVHLSNEMATLTNGGWSATLVLNGSDLVLTNYQDTMYTTVGVGYSTSQSTIDGQTVTITVQGNNVAIREG